MSLHPHNPPVSSASSTSGHSGHSLSPMLESEEPKPPVITHSTIQLDAKAGASLHYTYIAPYASTPTYTNPFGKTLLVFLNGLMSTRSSWDATIDLILKKRGEANLPYPALLSYDRYGQGDSDRDPDDKEPPPCHGHDVMSAVHDLRQLLLQIWKSHLVEATPRTFPHVIFVANSIGCAIARLFAQTYPATVSGLLFLDSIIATTDFVSLFPDPDSPDFDPKTLPDGVAVEELRQTRESYRRVFHPSVPNMEGLSRRNLAHLLPKPDYPLLEGTDPALGPYMTIVGHDWETFAQQSLEGSLKTPRPLTMAYANPAWQRYNEGLCNLTSRERCIGPIVAVGCGHFVQKDGPGFVAGEVLALLDRVTNRSEQLAVEGAAGDIGEMVMG